MVLLLGFWGFSTLFTNKKLIVLLALLYFFPYQRFLQINAFYIGMGYSMLGFSLLFIRKINWKNGLFTYLPNLVYTAIVSIVWLLAIWCSDLVFLTLVTFGGTLILYAYTHKTPRDFKLLQIVIAYLGSLTLIFFVLKKAKTYAVVKTEQFMSFNTLSDVGEAVKIVVQQSTKVLLGSEDLILTIGAWIIVCTLIFGIYVLVIHRKSFLSFQYIWLNFFFFEGIAMLTVIFLSHWVLLNEMGRWYFVAPYISFGLFALLLADKTNILRSNKNYTIALVTFISLGMSSVSNVLYFTNGKYQPVPHTLAELNQLGEIGIIGNYWDAYRLSIANPDLIKATPYEGGGVRNEKLISAAFTQPKIYLSRDMWMEHFPDTIIQFGIPLYKIGHEQHLGGSRICQYEARRKKQVFSGNALNYLYPFSPAANGKLAITKNNQTLEDKILVFGPFTSILPGNYVLRIQTDTISPTISPASIYVDVSHNYGQNSTGFVDLNDLPRGKKENIWYFEKKIKVETLLQHVEFRILVKKATDFTFRGYELIPK